MSYNAWTHEFSCCGLADITVPGRVATRTLVKHVRVLCIGHIAAQVVA